jgi:site-specific recombinase XerD
MHLLQAGVAIEIIALWLGHEQINTTHSYIEADLNIKKETLAQLKAPRSGRCVREKAPSHILAFLEAQ